MLKRILKSIYLLIFNRGGFNGYHWYTATDEADKFKHLLEAVNYLRVTQQKPVIFEFGSHSGRTFSAMLSAAKLFSLPTRHFYSFDSFEGLPEEENMGVFKAGTFRTTSSKFRKICKLKTGVSLRSDQCIEGFYSNSLTDHLKDTLPTPSLVHIDVDLYESTQEVLAFIDKFDWDHLLLLFDDWYCFKPSEWNGERRAFEEYLIRRPNISVESWKNYSTFGKSFFIWRKK